MPFFWNFFFKCVNSNITWTHCIEDKVHCHALLKKKKTDEVIYIKLRIFSLERKKKNGAWVVIVPIFISMFHLRYPWRMKSNRSARLPIKVLNRFFGRWTLNIGSKTILTNDWSLSTFVFDFSCWRCLHILCWGWNFF